MFVDRVLSLVAALDEDLRERMRIDLDARAQVKRRRHNGFRLRQARQHRLR